MITNQEILKKSEELFPFMQKIRRTIHRRPEVGMKEFETTRLIRQELEHSGIPFRDQVGRMGVVGLIEGKAPGKVLGMRADIDALPLQEQNETEYKSEIPNVMHACGHDAHTAVLLGTARLLNEIKDSFNGAVKLIFQPAEEGPGGALPMIEDGVLENPKVDAVTAFHVSSEMKTGLVGILPGVTHAAQSEFNIRILGKGGHAASPHRGVDAIMMAGRVITALQTIVSRNIDPLEPAVLTIGKIAGGYRHNIIADEVLLQGTLRYLSPETGKKMSVWMEEIIRGIVHSHGGDYRLDVIEGYPVGVNNEKLARSFMESVADIVGSENLEEIKRPTMGAEDFAYFAQRVPSVFMRLGSAGLNGEYGYPHHHPKFDVDDNCLPIGCACFARIALDFLK